MKKYILILLLLLGIKAPAQTYTTHFDSNVARDYLNVADTTVNGQPVNRLYLRMMPTDSSGIKVLIYWEMRFGSTFDTVDNGMIAVSQADTNNAYFTLTNYLGLTAKP